MRPTNARSANGLFQGPDKTIFKAFFWNAGGLTTDKFTEWKEMIIKEDADLYGIVEAGLSTENLSYYQIPGYQTYALQRARQVASGIIVAAKSSLTVQFTIDKKMENNDKLEAVHLDVWKNKLRRQLIYVMYNPPMNKPNLNWLEAIWSPHDILYGDLNAPSTRWGYSQTTATGKLFEDFIDSYPVEIIRNEHQRPTFLSYSGNTSSPDAIFTHTSISGEISHTLEHAPGGFGHEILKIDIHKSIDIPKEPRTTRWNLKKANWDLFSRLSDLHINENTIQGSADAASNKICEAVLKCALKAIPRGCVKKYSPFWNEDLQKLKEERNRARNVFEFSRRPEDKIKLKAADARLRKEIIVSKRSTFDVF